MALGCGNAAGPAIQDPATQSLPSGYSLLEGFEAGIADTAWGLAQPGASIAATGASAHTGAAALAFQARPLAKGGAAILSRSVTLAQPANLRFWLRTDIGADVSTDFIFRLDDAASGSWNGLGGTWTAVDRLIPAGTHRLSWSLVRNSSLYYSLSSNSVYLDDVSLCADSAATVALDSAAPQEVVAGGELAFAATVLRLDGSAKADAPCSWELVPGSGSATLSQGGLLGALAAGSAGVRARCGALASATSPVTILPSNYLDLPVSFAGASYQGKASGGSGSPLLASSPRLSLSSPAQGSFSADAFFTIRGTASGSGATQYALVSLKKDNGTQEERSYYYVRGAFALRLWLRFGPGAYSVYLYPLTLTVDNLAYEGDINGWSYSSAAYSFSVTNTNQEDGRFSYPSDPLQADDLAIRNLASRLIEGRTGDRERLKSMHDYVVSTLYYDDASLVAGARKKQDALSSLANGTAVCEGYTSLFGALARAAGFQAKAAAGTVGSGNHAWNLVSYSGAWPMIDCTWDDPGPNDSSPSNIDYTYFLVPGPAGALGDHVWTGDRPDRGLVPGDEPGQVGPPGFGAYPPGSY